jgi:NAD(P)-dependent dehydrogenase (short-subunit alcohol dehydrogenase family)
MADSVATGHQDVDRLVNQVIPLGKLGTTDDIADAVTFLCSDMAGHITGCALPVCGGMQM